MKLNHSPDNDTMSMQLRLCVNKILRVLQENFDKDAYAIEAEALANYLEDLPEWASAVFTLSNKFWPEINKLHKTLLDLSEKYDISLEKQKEEAEKDGKLQEKVSKLGR